jgi:co-chaperonin GroES (HSP10)
MLKVNKNNIAVVPVFYPDKSEGGLWIPDIAKKRANQGVVKYVGSEVTDIKVGDYVLFSGYTGTTVRLAGGEGVVIIMHKDFVNAKIELGENIEVPGLYFYDKKSDIFFNATYEAAVVLLAQALEDTAKKLNVIADKPTLESYDAHK